MDEPLRVGFITGSESRLRRVGLAAKHRQMRFRRLVHPDVYSLPYFLTDRVDFLRDGGAIEPGRYHLILSELNRTERQLRFLASVLDAGHTPLAVIPGPPELLASTLDDASLHLARRVLRGAAHVWAYSDEVRDFADGLLGAEKARLIPWPFDYGRTAPFARPPRVRRHHHVLLGVPLRFSGISENFPFVLKAALQDVLAEMPREAAARFRFHAHVYTDADRRRFHDSGFARGLAVRLEPKRSYRSFLRFVGGCDAVVNLTSGSILGRITFLAAALGRPGLFSDNAAINTLLYPGATVPLLEPRPLCDALRRLLGGIGTGAAPAEFAPDRAAAARVGDFAANAETMRGLC